jgi:excisionase family DNA binding protein
LSVDELAAVLKISRATINNQISDGTFPIATYRAHGKRWADFQDVDAYLEQCREAAVVGA